jgi:heme/copper-type cytochrome/quinol oxidase subunit 2
VSEIRGHERGVALHVTLAVLTLGVWAAVYYFIAFREVDHQNGRLHNPMILLGLIPVLGLFFIVYYLVLELRLLKADRQALGLPEGPSVQEIVLWTTVGALILVGPFIALAKVMGLVNGYWDEVKARFAAAS